eukprot:1634834-Amphidinium_carterae.1
MSMQQQPGTLKQTDANQQQTTMRTTLATAATATTAAATATTTTATTTCGESNLRRHAWESMPRAEGVGVLSAPCNHW